MSTVLILCVCVCVCGRARNVHIYIYIHTPFVYSFCIFVYLYPDELLPTHLCIMEGINWTDKGAIASGWINTMQVLSKNEFVKDMSKLKLELCDTEVTELYENKYIFDPICPKMINLHDRMREKLAMSDLVRDHRFIFLVSKILIYFN